MPTGKQPFMQANEMYVVNWQYCFYKHHWKTLKYFYLEYWMKKSCPILLDVCVGFWGWKGKSCKKLEGLKLSEKTNTCCFHDLGKNCVCSLWLHK